MADALTPPDRPETPAPAPTRRHYVAPAVTTYTDADLLEALGPAQAQAGYQQFPN